VLIAFVLRLERDALAAGRIVGEAEHVETRTCRTVTSGDALLRWLLGREHDEETNDEAAE
jgi:hypothetical protein